MEINGRTEDIHGNHTGYFYIEVPLRDLLAAFALAGILASPTRMSEDAASNADKAAEWAYVYADATLAVRGETEG